MADGGPGPVMEHTSWVLRWWPILTATVAAIAAGLRVAVLTPRARLTTLESKTMSIDDKLDSLADGIDELRVTQVRMSDAHADAISSLRVEHSASIDKLRDDLTGRMDHILDLMLGGAHAHRCTDKPGD